MWAPIPLYIYIYQILGFHSIPPPLPTRDQLPAATLPRDPDSATPLSSRRLGPSPRSRAPTRPSGQHRAAPRTQRRAAPSGAAYFPAPVEAPSDLRPCLGPAELRRPPVQSQPPLHRRRRSSAGCRSTAGQALRPQSTGMHCTDASTPSSATDLLVYARSALVCA